MKTTYALLPLLLLCAGPALAQSDQGNSQSSSTTTTMSNMSVRQQIKDSLQKDGYQDVSVLPASFVVHAKDKNGKTTAMVITPDSTFVVTEDATSKGGAGDKGASSPQDAQH